MQITEQIIGQYLDHHEDLRVLQDTMSELLKAAQTVNGSKEHELVRDGKKVLINERTLWQEVYHLGADCEAGKILKHKYAAIFEAQAKEQAKVNEIKDFEVTNFGFNYRQMTLPNTIALIRGLIQFELCKQQPTVIQRLRKLLKFGA